MARYLSEEEIRNKKDKEVKDIFHGAMEDIENKIREAYNFPKKEEEIDEVDDEHFVNVCEWF